MKYLLYIALLLSFSLNASGQLSPGELSDAHKEFEGLNNCTKCHSLGSKVPDNKCLDCHTEINSLIEQDRGYHASAEVQTKTCIDCHSEHHGRKFDLDRFDQDAFEHPITGYELEGAHQRIDCKSCHKADNIADKEIRKRQETFLGLQAECLSCHEDYHQNTLGEDCRSCHTMEKWDPAEIFDHNKTDFELKGAHKKVECNLCHKETVRNGKEFQEFSEITFSKCTDCHEDEHQGSFGANCTDCHNETAWNQLNAGNRFDHNLTDFPLEGLHQQVDCAVCHKSGSLTQPMAHQACKDCHQDYHQGQFTSTNPRSDCDQCHTLIQPFTQTTFGFEEHQDSPFSLEGAHLATPCFACHVSEDDERWEFRNIGSNCVDCHENIHEETISANYFPEEDCTQCHNSERWNAVTFDHDLTKWPLEGEHSLVDCRACHFSTTEETEIQQFKSLSTDCVTCHDNIHGEQFNNVDGITECTRCHTIAKNWKPEKFDHDSTLFPLEGRHDQVECNACHKPQILDDNTERIEYKIKKFECKDCHS